MSLSGTFPFLKLFRVLFVLWPFRSQLLLLISLWEKYYRLFLVLNISIISKKLGENHFSYFFVNFSPNFTMQFTSPVHTKIDTSGKLLTKSIILNKIACKNLYCQNSFIGNYVFCWEGIVPISLGEIIWQYGYIVLISALLF